jgi:hypothetical protein
MNQAIPYILAFLALLYLALPHVYECYVSYSRPWNTHEEMTNADVASKHEFHTGQPTVWEMFTETEVKTDKQLASILPGETVKPAGSKTILPGVPTPKNDVPAGPIGPSNKKEVEEAIDKTPYLQPEEEPKAERANKRTMDPDVQKPMKSAPPTKSPPAKVLKVTPKPTPAPAQETNHSGQEIWGPRAPKLDPNQPRPSDSGNGKNKSGVYPDIYGPEMLEAPGHADKGGGDSSNPPPYDYVPAAEFPAGPLQPSPYLNDFSKMLKT